jgi:hypothetical protein
MDLRSQHYGRATASRPDEILPPLFWVVGQFLIGSALLSLAVFMRVDVWAFAFLGLTLSTLLIAAAVVVEFGEIVMGPEDAAIVGHRPLSLRTYAAARLTNLGAFVLLLYLAANVIPAILGAALRDSGLWFIPAYAIASGLGACATTALVAVAYSLAARYERDSGARDVLAWTQIVLIMAVFYGAQLMFRDPSHEIETFLARPPAWMSGVPLAWLADFVSTVSREGPSFAALRWLLVAVTLVGLFVLLLLARLAHLYGSAQAGGAWIAGPAARLAAPSRFGRLGGSFEASRPLRGLLALCLVLLARDQELRMRLVAGLATVAAAVAMGWATGQLGDPQDPGSGNPVLSLAAVQLLVLAVPSMIHGMGFSREHAASWILAAAPLPVPHLAAEAVRRAVCYGVALPAVLALSLVFALAWQKPLAAALQGLIAWLEVLIVSHLSLRAMRFGLPFSRPSARGDVLGPVAPWLAAVATAGTGLALVQYWVGPRLPGTLALLAALGVVWLASRGGAHARTTPA